MVSLGTIASIWSAWQFQRLVGTLSPRELPPKWDPVFTGYLAYALAAAGFGLCFYLAL